MVRYQVVENMEYSFSLICCKAETLSDSTSSALELQVPSLGNPYGRFHVTLIMSDVPSIFIV